MGSDTKIEWATHTFNPWSGCTKVSAGCANCYAAALPPGMRRHAEWGEGRGRVVASEAYWRQPLAWDRAASKAGERHRVFCASTADVFEAREDLDVHRDRLFYLIQTTPHLDWLLLTKRPEYAVEWWGRQVEKARRNDARAWWPTNAWFGTSVEDQAAADARIPHLLQIPARVRFLSMEPLLGPVRLTAVGDGGEIGATYDALRGAMTGAVDCDTGGPRIQWVIVGGESGRHARPMHPEWARSLRDQCVRAGVPFFFKQWGGWAPRTMDWDIDYEATAKPSGMPYWTEAGGSLVYAMLRVGKHDAGRLLDGREWSEVPR